MVGLTAQRLIEIEKAIISLPRKGGRGVLINEEMVLTAAHCIACNCGSRMTLEEANPVPAKAGSLTFRLDIIFVDPISDIAVLAPLDPADFMEDYEAFSRFVNEVKPIKISCNPFIEPFEWVDCKAFNANKQWIDIQTEITRPDSQLLLINSETQIQPGASGGPIVNDSGELVTIISNTSFGDNNTTGKSPIPLLTLPRWILLKAELIEQ